VKKESVSKQLEYCSEYMKGADTKILTATEASILNLYPDSKGHIARLIGYKSFAGMIYQLKRINKRCIKNNWSLDFTIRLPLKWK
jgi:hypothetical protein